MSIDLPPLTLAGRTYQQSYPNAKPLSSIGLSSSVPIWLDYWTLYPAPNGTLLTRQPEDFWRVCHDSKITLQVTHYPVNIDIPKIRELAEKFGVEILCAEKPVDSFIKSTVNLNGNGDYRKNFALCPRANNCPLIYHGKLFTCTFAPNVRHFNSPPFHL